MLHNREAEKLERGIEPVCSLTMRLCVAGNIGSAKPQTGGTLQERGDDVKAPSSNRIIRIQTANQLHPLVRDILGALFTPPLVLAASPRVQQGSGHAEHHLQAIRREGGGPAAEEGGTLIFPLNKYI